MANWSDLSHDLLDLVIERLNIADYYSFSQVCLSWRSVIQENRICKFPCLVLFDVYNDEDSATRAFLKLSDNKVCELLVSELSRKYCNGSSHGWLITTSRDKETLHLLNPFSRVQIQLPPLSTFPSPDCFGDDPETYTYSRKFIRKAILSSNPGTSSDFIIMAIFYQNQLAFCRMGDKRWTNIELSGLAVADIIYHKGKFYTLHEDGRVAVCNLGDSTLAEVIINPPPTLHEDGRVAVCNLGDYPTLAEVLINPPPYIIRGTEYHFRTIYLAELSGDLLQVCRYINEIDHDDSESDSKQSARCKTMNIVVLKLNTRESTWEELRSIDNHILFLGRNDSISLPSTDFPGLKGNRIYFTGDLNEGYFSGCLDSVLWDLEDGRIEQYLPDSIAHSFLSPSIYISPNP